MKVEPKVIGLKASDSTIKVAYELNTEDPRAGSSIEVAEIKTLAATLIIKRGWFGGGLPVGEWGNPKYQSVIISIELRDGSSTVPTIVEDMEKNKNWVYLVHKWIKKYLEKEKQIDYHLKERERLFTEMEPLQDQARHHANKIFDIIGKD